MFGQTNPGHGESIQSIAGVLTDTTDNSSIESSALANNRNKNSNDKELVEPIFENRDEEEYVSDGMSGSIREAPTFGKASNKSSKSGSRMQRSTSNTRERQNVYNNQPFPRVEGLTKIEAPNKE